MSTLTCHRAAEAMPPLIVVASMSYVVDVCGLLLRLWETNTLALLLSLLGPFFSHYPFLLLGDWLIFFLDPAHFLLFFSFL